MSKRKVRPSSAPFQLICNHFEPGRTSKEAKEGQEAHKVCEHLHNDNLPPLDKIKLSSEVLDKCSLGVAKVNSYIIENFGAIEHQETEKKVSIKGYNGKEIANGTQDLHSFTAGGEVGADYKLCPDYNYTKIDYKPQQCFYALARMQASELEEIEWIEYYIMPEKLKHYVLTREYCEAIVDRTFQAVKDRKKTSKFINYGCRFCKNFDTCDEVFKVPEIMDYKHLPELLRNPELVKTDKDLQLCLTMSKNVLNVISNSIKEINDNLSRVAIPWIEKNGLEHWKVQSSTSYDIIDILECSKRLSSELNQEQFLNCVKGSFSKLKKAMYESRKDKNIKTTHPECKDDLLNILEGIIDPKTKKSIRSC